MKLICSILIWGLMFCLIGQTKEQLTPNKISKLEVGFQGIGIAEDYHLTQILRLNLFAGLGGGYRITTTGLDYRLYPKYPSLYIGSQLRYNYRRMKIIKYPIFNTNFIGMTLRFTTKSLDESKVVAQNLVQTNSSRLINLHWGIQRKLKRKFLLSGHIGLGIARDLFLKNNIWYPSIDMRLSYLTTKF